MPAQFRILLERLLTERGLSKRQFALAVKIHAPTLHAIMAGKRPFPKRCVALGVAFLELSAAERQEFEDAASLTHATPEIRAIVDRLERTAGKPRSRR